MSAPQIAGPWRRIGPELAAGFGTPSLATAAQFVQAATSLATELDVTLSLDLRPDRVVLRVPAGATAFTDEVTGLARELDLPTAPTPGPLHPVSVKGVVLHEGRVLLLRNERDEWELPGGRLEPGETPQECVEREVAEEVDWHVTAGALLDARVHEVLPGRHVLVVTYACALRPGTGEPRVSEEHRELGLFSPDELAGLPLPAGYRRSIERAVTHP